MRTEKTIQRLINEWKGNQLLVTGLYRLFTYIKWENISKEYQEHFPPEAKEKWNEDLKDYKEHHILLDIQTEMVSVLNALDKKNITQAFSVIPIMLADTYVYGKPIVKLQVALINATNQFIKNVGTAGRELAEVAAIYDIVDILKEVKKLLKLNLNFDIDEQLDRIISKIYTETIMTNKGSLIKGEESAEK